MPALISGCKSNGSGTVAYEFVEGRPYPEQGAFRYEGVFNAGGDGIDAILLVDGNEADRRAIRVGEKQKVTLRCSELTAGQHQFELQLGTKMGAKKVANGIVIIR
jgi:hypothetical protein